MQSQQGDGGLYLVIAFLSIERESFNKCGIWLVLDCVDSAETSLSPLSSIPLHLPRQAN